MGNNKRQRSLSGVWNEMIITETKELIEEKRELLIKLDSDKNYANEIEKEKDELRLGEIELEVRKIIKSKIERLKTEAPQQVIQALKLSDEKDARKMRRVKRDIYKDLAKECYNIYQELVEKKKIGVELEEKLQTKNIQKYDIKRLLSEVRRY